MLNMPSQFSVRIISPGHGLLKSVILIFRFAGFFESLGKGAGQRRRRTRAEHSISVLSPDYFSRAWTPGNCNSNTQVCRFLCSFPFSCVALSAAISVTRFGFKRIILQAIAQSSEQHAPSGRDSCGSKGTGTQGPAQLGFSLGGFVSPENRAGRRATSIKRGGHETRDP